MVYSLRHMVSVTLLMVLSIYTWAYDIPRQPKAQDRTNWVSNTEGILAPGTVDSLNIICARIEAATQVELCIIATAGVEDTDIADYNYRVFQTWGIGKQGKNTGLLLTLWRDQHAVHITTGGSIEQILTDALCSRICNEVMIPYFRHDDYDRGMLAGAHAIEDICLTPDHAEELLAAHSTTSRGYYGEQAEGEDDTVGILLAFVVMILIILLVWWIMRHLPHDPNNDSTDSGMPGGMWIGSGGSSFSGGGMRGGSFGGGSTFGGGGGGRW